ncbi:MAG: winged helix-turn-helix transcriptional regulator [Promethearchaeota archaeon]
MISPQVNNTDQITTRKKKNTSRQSNVEKILDYLKEQKKDITISELSEGTGINIKNISRYLKPLKENEKITIEGKQEGKIRYKVVKLATTRNRKNTTRKLEKVNHEPTEQQKTPKKSSPKKQDLSILLEKIDRLVEENLNLKQYIKALETVPIGALRALLRSYASKWAIGKGRYPQSEGIYDTIKRWLENLIKLDINEKEAKKAE